MRVDHHIKSPFLVLGIQCLLGDLELVMPIPRRMVCEICHVVPGTLALVQVIEPDIAAVCDIKMNCPLIRTGRICSSEANTQGLWKLLRPCNRQDVRIEAVDTHASASP